MAAPLIRLARNSDAHCIAVMSRCLIEVGLRGWSWDPARVTRAMRHREVCIVVAEINKHIEGFAIAEFGDTRMHLSLLAVNATQQRKGIGRALVEWLEQSARTAGMADIQLELRANNPGARFFYAALGFEFVRAVPGYYSGIETALRMQKTLRTATAENLEYQFSFKNIHL
jgi:[ribosomal protein S18]-alanine N-acetyltransferase